VSDFVTLIRFYTFSPGCKPNSRRPNENFSSITLDESGLFPDKQAEFATSG